MPDEEPLLKPADAARALGVATSTLARWRREKLIEATEVTVGGQARYRLSHLREQVRKIDEQRKSR